MTLKINNLYYLALLKMPIPGLKPCTINYVKPYLLIGKRLSVMSSLTVYGSFCI